MEFDHIAKGALNIEQQISAARDFNTNVARRQNNMMTVNGRAGAFIGQAQVRIKNNLWIVWSGTTFLELLKHKR